VFGHVGPSCTQLATDFAIVTAEGTPVVSWAVLLHAHRALSRCIRVSRNRVGSPIQWYTIRARTIMYRSTGQQRLRWIGEEPRALSHPNQAEFYTSGRSSNEAAFLYQLFAREFGATNFPDCSFLVKSGFELVTHPDRETKVKYRRVLPGNVASVPLSMPMVRRKDDDARFR
jgi:hypothetical protein